MSFFVCSGGYTAHMYDHTKLKDNARRLSTLIPHLMARTGAEFIAVTGKSGQALAFATLMLTDFPLVVVRKDHESSHGSSIEGKTPSLCNKYLILDDFVQTGATVHRIQQKIALHAHGTEVECVGVIEYDRSEAWYALKEPDSSCDVIRFGAAYDEQDPTEIPLTRGWRHVA